MSESNSNDKQSNRSFEKKKKAVLQVDCDTLEELADCYQIPFSKNNDYLIKEGLEKLGTFLEGTSVSITLFLVGRTIAQPGNRVAVRSFLEHTSFPVEVASHSMTHPFHFHRFSQQQKKREIKESKDLLEDTFNTRVVGFKAPSYYFDPSLIKHLEAAGYLYDSSLWPSSLILPMKLLSGSFHNYGRGSNLFQPNHPFKLTDNLWEIPVSCSPFFRLPLHSSFLLAGGDIYRKIIQRAFNRLPFLCYSFHLIDFVKVKEKKLKKLRGYHLPWKEKRRMLETILETIQNVYTIVSIKEYIREHK